MAALPLGSPPRLVHFFGVFSESVHGLRGDEPYWNSFWVLNLVSGGSGTLEIDGIVHPFGDKSALLVPPDKPHRYHFDAPVTKTFAHFRTDPEAATAPVPVVQALGDRFDWFRTTIHECRSVVDSEPERATAVLWNLLWKLTSGPAGGVGPRHHPLVLALTGHLEASLEEPFDLDRIAMVLEVSTTHLNRLCRAAFGLSTGAFVRRFRLERAVHLLSHTRTPVASIAAAVGIPDLQHFNKLVRTHTGLSPRALRRG
jgi:AraC family transcriptional regulator